jgi:hypothetical protein
MHLVRRLLPEELLAIFSYLEQRNERSVPCREQDFLRNCVS